MSFSRLIISVGMGERERAGFLLSITRYLLFYVRRSASSSWCLGTVALFYCGTHCAFHITEPEVDTDRDKVIGRFRVSFSNRNILPRHQFLYKMFGYE